jgi:fructose-1,6-bisphosphatase/sedoheptulose 1,7-bisphosphatase-like protein
MPGSAAVVSSAPATINLSVMSDHKSQAIHDLAHGLNILAREVHGDTEERLHQTGGEIVVLPDSASERS